jgi:hypothetical protein
MNAKKSCINEYSYTICIVRITETAEIASTIVPEAATSLSISPPLRILCRVKMAGHPNMVGKHTIMPAARSVRAIRARPTACRERSLELKWWKR